MKFPIVVKQKKEFGEIVFEAFCPLFEDAETFSFCDSKREAVDEVKEIVQDEVDDLVDAGEKLPRVPSKEELEKKYPNEKIVWVSVDETDSAGDDDLFDDSEEDDDDNMENDDVDDLDLDEIMEDDEDDDE